MDIKKILVNSEKSLDHTRDRHIIKVFGDAPVVDGEQIGGV